MHKTTTFEQAMGLLGKMLRMKVGKKIGINTKLGMRVFKRIK